MSNACQTIGPPSATNAAMTTGEVNRLARAFEHSAAGIALQSPDGVWLEVNPAFCDMVGYGRDELVGKSFTGITHAEDIERSLQQLDRLNRKEISSFRFDKRYIHASDHEVWVRLDVSMVLDSEDRPELIITQAHDITASRRIREQLAENEARLGSIIRSMAEGVIVIETDGRFSVANQRAAQILGTVPGALESLSLLEFDSHCWRLDGTPIPLDEFPASVTLATGRPQREVIMGLECAYSGEREH
ncbi:MAG: PAS domain S-box protein [Wenzhouxiangellaceae bacterium]